MLVKINRQFGEDWLENVYNVKFLSKKGVLGVWSNSVTTRPLTFDLSSERESKDDTIGVLSSIVLYSNGGIKLRTYKAEPQPQDMAGQGV